MTDNGQYICIIKLDHLRSYCVCVCVCVCAHVTENDLVYRSEHKMVATHVYLHSHTGGFN